MDSRLFSLITFFLLLGLLFLFNLKMDRIEDKLDDHIKNHKVDQSLTYSTLEPEEGKHHE
jgi:low temperature requirement protein LtrA